MSTSPSSAATARVALVTGGGRGIGRGIVEELAGQGHRVAVADINKDTAAEVAAVVKGFAVRLDITDTASVNGAFDTVERELGQVEILVNNAGWDEFHPFLETEEEFWDRV